MLARDPDPPWRMKTAVSRDDRHRTADPVLDHRYLFEDVHDAPRAFPSTAMPSPTPLIARSTMTTIVIRELTQHPVEAI